MPSKSGICLVTLLPANGALSSSLTAPQAFYVDAPAQAYAGQEVGTYTFSE